MACWIPVTWCLILALFSAGCASSALWEKQAWRPSDFPDLRLDVNVTNQDLLVQYTEQIEDTKHTRRRAYWLWASTNSIAELGKPLFVKAPSARGLSPLPVFEKKPTAMPPHGYLAVATHMEQGFDLWWDAQFLGRFYLPVYTESPEVSSWRIAASPFAALSDATIIIIVIGLSVGVTVGILYLENKAK
jgi:hypothetical protein